MKRIRIVGLCLVAAFALTAVIASAAQAATPEYQVCALHKKGEYTEGNCATKSVKAHKGSFERVAAAGCAAQKKGNYTEGNCLTKSVKPHKGTFEKTAAPTSTSLGGTAELETPALSGPVVCTSSKATSTTTSPTTGTSQINFESCETSGKKCASEGSPSGVIATPTLVTGLTEPTAGEVQTTFVGPGGESSFSSEFSCGAGVLWVRTHGIAGGVTTPVNTPGTASKLSLKLGEGTQGLLTEKSKDGRVTWEPAGGDPSIETSVTNNITWSQTVILKS